MAELLQLHVLEGERGKHTAELFGLLIDAVEELALEVDALTPGPYDHFDER